MSGSRFRRGAGLGLGVEFGSGLRPWCADEFGWLLGGSPEFGRAARAGFASGVGLGGGRGARCGDGFGGPFERLSPRLDEDVVLVGDEVVVVVEVVESEAEERDVRDDGESRAAGAGAGCWVLCARRTRVRGPASGVCARFPCCPACLLVLVLWVVSCVGVGVVALSRLRG